MGQLEDMEVFVRIVEAGGIGKASEQLNIAKSAVSRRLVDLETKFKTQLINRTTRNWSLTEAGENFYQRAKHILDDVSHLNSEITDEDVELSGTLKITVPLSFGVQHFNSIIDEFSRLHPKLNIQIDLTDRHVDLVEEGHELAVRIAELEDSSLRAKLIVPIRHVLVASPNYIKEKGEPEDLEALSKHPFLKYNLSVKSSIIFTSTDNERIPFSPETKISANNADFLKDMAIRGHGISYLPTFLVYNEILQGELVPLLPDYKLPILHAYAVYPNNRFLSMRARALIDFIAEHCGEVPYWDQKLGILY